MPKISITDQGENTEPYIFRLLIGDTHGIGRGQHNYIMLNCESTSTHHCEIERVDGGFILKDKKSTNGIKKEGVAMKVIDLYDGMKVLIGDVIFDFQLTEEEVEQLKGEIFTSHEIKKKSSPKLARTALASTKKAPATPSNLSLNHRQTIAPVSQKSSKTPVVLIVILVGGMTGLALFNKARKTQDSPYQEVINTEEKNAQQSKQKTIPKQQKNTTAQNTEKPSEKFAITKVEPKVLAKDEEKEEVKVASNPPSAAPSEVPSTAEASDLRASVQTEISIKGTIHSYPHKRRKNLKIHMLKSFDGTSYELPRYGKNTSPGIKLEGLDKTAVKVTLRVIPRVNGAIKQITISYLLAVEKLGANEPRN